MEGAPTFLVPCVPLVPPVPPLPTPILLMMSCRPSDHAPPPPPRAWTFSFTPPSLPTTWCPVSLAWALRVGLSCPLPLTTLPPRPELLPLLCTLLLPAFNTLHHTSANPKPPCPSHWLKHFWVAFPAQHNLLWAAQWVSSHPCPFPPSI